MEPRPGELGEMRALIEAFLSSEAAPVVAAIFGALWGSFFNVCIARVPLGKSVVRPGSHCFSCQAPVRAWDNLPILSYFILRGRCRRCGARFSPRYLFVELLGAALSLAVFFVFVRAQPDEPLGVRAASYFTHFAFAGVLTVLAFIDIDTKRLPDVITLPSIPVFFLAGFGTHFAPWSERAIGIAGGYLVIRVVSDGYYYLRGREGLGLGDAKLLALMGAALGWKALLPIVFFGSVLGVLVGIPLLLLARRRMPVEPPAPEDRDKGDREGGGQGDGDDADDDERAAPLRFAQVPFGPFLALGALGFLLLSDSLWPWLYGLFTGDYG